MRPTLDNRNYVETVATEVWLNYWSSCDKAQLRRLSAVRSWHWREDPVLETELRHLYPLITNVCQDTWLRLVGIFKTTLGAYQRLAVLHLNNFTIDTDFRATLSSLEFLKDLKLNHCDIICRTGTLLWLWKLDLAGNYDPAASDQLEIVTPGTLQNTAAGLFFDCLDHCLQLESIRIDNLIIDGSILTPNRLPATAIPILNRFRGPHNIAGLFVDGRSVVDITVKDPFGGTAKEPIPCLHGISGGSVPLRNLFLDGALLPTCMPEFFATVVSLFPELRVPAESPPDNQGPDDNDNEEVEEEEEVDNQMVELWEGSWDVPSSEPDFDVIDEDSDIDSDDAPPAMPAEIPMCSSQSRGLSTLTTASVLGPIVTPGVR
ncbi:hypothetical protein C8R44DRAFT_746969 [Mycena epipterygia]|nr:hypothetical protein C8R44DRAFT_746969 [Mycena epipterygia]